MTIKPGNPMSKLNNLVFLQTHFFLQNGTIIFLQLGYDSKMLLMLLRMMVLQVRDQEVPEVREARLAQLREHNAVVNRFVCTSAWL